MSWYDIKRALRVEYWLLEVLVFGPPVLGFACGWWTRGMV